MATNALITWLETTDGQKYYVFGVEKDVWNKIEVSACYQFTYYPAKSLFGEYLRKRRMNIQTYMKRQAVSRGSKKLTVRRFKV